MRYFTLFFCWVFLLSSCTTVEFVRKDQTPRKQGIIRHAIPSNEKRAAEYREKVATEARAFCGGEFEITKEYEAREDSGISTGAATGFGVGFGGIMLGGSNRGTSMYNFVEFVCKSE
jgi:hypothetical protein